MYWTLTSPACPFPKTSCSVTRSHSLAVSSPTKEGARGGKLHSLSLHGCPNLSRVPAWASWVHIVTSKEGILGAHRGTRQQEQNPTISSSLSGDAKWLQERNAWSHFLSVPLCPKVRESCFRSPLTPSSACTSTGAPSKPSFEMPAVHTPILPPQPQAAINLVTCQHDCGDTAERDPINLG